MDVDILLVPYDSGLRGVRLGAGPERLVDAGLPDRLADAGHGVRTEVIEAGASPATENAVTFELARTLAGRVAAAVRDGRFPLVLAGNCSSAPGTVAGLRSGLGADAVAVIWHDAHGDLNTPETTETGFLDGMALSILTGRCWARMAGAIPGFSPAADDDVLLVGARALDGPEERLLDAGGPTRVAAAEIREAGSGDAVRGWVDGAAGRTEHAYLHVDLDVLDPSEARANDWATDGGLRIDDVEELADAVGRRIPLRAAAVTAYDPAGDRDGEAARAGIAVALRAVEAAARGA